MKRVVWCAFLADVVVVFLMAIYTDVILRLFGYDDNHFATNLSGNREIGANGGVVQRDDDVVADTDSMVGIFLIVYAVLLSVMLLLGALSLRSMNPMMLTLYICCCYIDIIVGIIHTYSVFQVMHYVIEMVAVVFVVKLRRRLFDSWFILGRHY